MHNWLVTGSYTIYLSNLRNLTKASKELRMCSACGGSIVSGQLESNHLVMNGALLKSDGNTINTPNISKYCRDKKGGNRLPEIEGHSIGIRMAKLDKYAVCFAVIVRNSGQNVYI